LKGSEGAQYIALRRTKIYFSKITSSGIRFRGEGKENDRVCQSSTRPPAEGGGHPDDALRRSAHWNKEL